MATTNNLHKASFDINRFNALRYLPIPRCQKARSIRVSGAEKCDMIVPLRRRYNIQVCISTKRRKAVRKRADILGLLLLTSEVVMIDKISAYAINPAVVAFFPSLAQLPHNLSTDAPRIHTSAKIEQDNAPIVGVAIDLFNY